MPKYRMRLYEIRGLEVEVMATDENEARKNIEEYGLFQDGLEVLDDWDNELTIDSMNEVKDVSGDVPLQ